MPRDRATPRRRGAETATTGDRLIKAALQEFRLHGYYGTDSNKIARRAGFAPQTFYRWFADKTQIFLAVYQMWLEEEQRTLDELISRHAATAQLVDAVIAHHRQFRLFRRSLRQLAVEDAGARKTRADSRKAQIDRIRARSGLADDRSGAIATLLLQIERLADAFAEGEFEDLGFGADAARREMAALIDKLARPA